MSRSLFIPALTLLFSLGACKKESTTPTNGGPKDSTTNISPPGGPTVPMGCGKKGADFSTNMKFGTWNGDIVALKAFWYYTWGTPLPSPSPQNCEFVSMFWGAANVTSANITAVQTLKAQGKVKYVLGFNEPNRGDQAIMTVSQALQLWPQLESIGLPLGSPAADWPTQKWIYDFLDSCITEKKRVDFICVHMYPGGLDDNSFVQTLVDLHNKYNKDIWITEFAVADWSATKLSDNDFTPDQVLAFMKRLLPKLEELPYVKRYSWFSGDPTTAPLWSSALIDANGSLTALGTWYANYQPNTAIAK